MRKLIPVHNVSSLPHWFVAAQEQEQEQAIMLGPENQFPCILRSAHQTDYVDRETVYSVSLLHMVCRSVVVRYNFPSFKIA